MGKKIIHTGPVGSGKAFKIVNQLLNAGNTLVASEALHLARRMMIHLLAAPADCATASAIAPAASTAAAYSGCSKCTLEGTKAFLCAALLHDLAANRYHGSREPDSYKHTAGVPFLSYSSLSRNAQYGNRVAYEVIRNRSPRLDGPVGSDEP